MRVFEFVCMYRNLYACFLICMRVLEFVMPEVSDIQLLNKAFVYITNCNPPYTVTGRLDIKVHIYANDL